MTREVVLVPGLWAPGAMMSVLALRLAGAGYRPRVFYYHGRSPFDANVERLAHFAHDGTRHFIGHSLGGVLVFETLTRHPEVKATSALLLGAPVRGSYAGRRLGRHQAGRWMMGGCGHLWGEREPRWTRRDPLGVIAGTQPLGLGRALGRLPGENDGVVCVSETSVDGMTAHARVPAGHSVLLVSGQVGRLMQEFLRSGRFA